MSNTQTATQLRNYQDQQQTIDTMNKWEQDVQRDIPQRQLKAGDEAKSVASYAMGKDATVGRMSKLKRRKAGNTKKDLQRRAVDLAGNTDQRKWTDNNPTALKGDEKLKYDIGMLSTTRDFLAFRSDTTFLDYYNENYTELDRLSKFGDSITTYLGTKPAALTDKKKEEVKAKIERNKDIKSFYDAKLVLLKNPFYTILKKSDVDSMTDQELDERIRKLREMYAPKNTTAAGKNANAAATPKTTEILDNDPEIVKYFVASRILRNLEKKDIAREKSDALVDKVAFKRQNSGGTSKRHKAYVEILPFKADAGIQAGAQVFNYGNTWNLKKDSEESTEGDTEENTKEDTKSDFKYEGYIGAEADLSAKSKLAKASYKYKRKYFETGINGSFLSGQVHSGIGASFGVSVDEDEENAIVGDVGVGIDTNLDVIKARGKIKAHLNPENFLDGDITAIGADAKLEAKVGTGSASGFVKAGRVIVETAKGKEEAKGIMIGATAEASIASATASAGLTFLGLRIGASLTGKLGTFGGTFGVAATSKNIGCELGLLAGLGLTLKLDVDFSEWTDLLAKKIKKPIKDAIVRKAKGTVV